MTVLLGRTRRGHGWPGGLTSLSSWQRWYCRNTLRILLFLQIICLSNRPPHRLRVALDHPQ